MYMFGLYGYSLPHVPYAVHSYKNPPFMFLGTVKPPDGKISRVKTSVLSPVPGRPTPGLSRCGTHLSMSTTNIILVFGADGDLPLIAAQAIAYAAHVHAHRFTDPPERRQQYPAPAGGIFSVISSQNFCQTFNLSPAGRFNQRGNYLIVVWATAVFGADGDLPLIAAQAIAYAAYC